MKSNLNDCVYNFAMPQNAIIVFIQIWMVIIMWFPGSHPRVPTPFPILPYSNKNSIILEVILYLLYKIFQLTTLGTFFLILGSLALTAGQVDLLSHPRAGNTLGLVVVNMVVAGAFSGLTTTIGGGALARRSARRSYQWSVLYLGNGILVGMVSKLDFVLIVYINIFS